MRRILLHLGQILLFMGHVAVAAPAPTTKSPTDKQAIRRAVLAGKTGWTSSGGEGWFCKDEVYSLDLVEAITRDPNYRLHNPKEANAEEYLKTIVFQRWAKAFPDFARQFWSAYQKLPLSQWEDQELPQLKDRGAADVPDSPDCVIRNLAVRYSLSLGTQMFPEVFVDYDRAAFLKLPAMHQVALLIHETIYTMARELGHMNSAGVRQLTAWLLSERFVRDSFVMKDGKAAVHPNALETMSTYLSALGLMDWRLLFREPTPDAGAAGETRAALQKAYLELRTLYKKSLDHKSAEGESSNSAVAELDAKMNGYRARILGGTSHAELAKERQEIYGLFEKKTHLVYGGMLANFSADHAFMFMVANDLRIRRSGVNPETFLHSEDINKSISEACFVLQARAQEMAADPVRNQMTEAFDPRKWIGFDGDLFIFKVPGAHKMIDRALERCR